MISFNLTGIIILSNLILSCNLRQHHEAASYRSGGWLRDLRISGVPDLPILGIELFGLHVFQVLRDGVLEHGLTVTTGIKAAREATEEQEAQMDLDMIVERFVAGCMVIAKWAETQHLSRLTTYSC